MFGDREKFLDKFKTCVRCRPYHNQKLESEYYIKEHSKPLFNENKILCLKNLYYYHCAIEVFKVIKFRSPVVLYEMYNFSTRSHKSLFLITPPPNETFLYKSSVIWNFVNKLLKFEDLAFSIASFKLKIKECLINKQSIGNSVDWIELNFMET